MLASVLQADSSWQGPGRRTAMAYHTQVQVWAGLLSVLIEVRWILTHWIACRGKPYYSPRKTDSATVDTVMHA